MAKQAPVPVPSRPVTHRIKCWPEVFRAALTGRLRFQIRRDDRGYQTGDAVELIEFEPEPRQGKLVEDAPSAGRTTGRSAMYVIGYVLRTEAIPEGWCGFDLISPEDINRVGGAVLR